MNEITFQGRNRNIREAYKIINKVNKAFPVVCPWKINRFSNNDGGIIRCPISQEKLDIFRNHAAPDFISDYKYAAKIIEGINQFKSANCKELSELSYLIAKANDINNCYCASLYGRKSKYSSKLNDFGHCVLLIMPKPVNNPKFVNKYYVDNVNVSDSIIPNNNVIVVDAVLGIVDYWKNALLKYAQTPLKEISPDKDIRVCLRQPLLKKENEITKLKKNYPVLNFNCKSDEIKRHFSFRKAMQELRIFAKAHNVKICSELGTEDTRWEIWTAIKSYFKG